MVHEHPSVVVTRRLPDAVEARMMELFDVKLRQDDAAMTQEQLAQAMAQCDILVPTINDRIDAQMLDKAAALGRLKMIANYGAGVDHIDVAAAQRNGIMVTNTPGVSSEDTADLAISLILAVTRRFREGMTIMATGQWDGWSPTGLLGRRIRGRDLGILGMGRIGQEVAMRARAFGMQVHYHNRNRLHPDIEAQFGATYWDSLDQMLSRMDVVSVNCPHTPASFHLMNARRLKLMKSEAVIVNTSRGEVVDENALTRMLRAGEIAGAGLDVYENSNKINPRLRDLPNVVTLPHMGSATIEGRIEMGEKVMINIKTFVDGHRPPDQIVDRFEQL